VVLGLDRKCTVSKNLNGIKFDVNNLKNVGDGRKI
jgi:hypothetical protein